MELWGIEVVGKLIFTSHVKIDSQSMILCTENYSHSVIKLSVIVVLTLLVVLVVLVV